MCNLFLSVSFIVSVKVRIFPLNMRDIIIYVAQWWEKYLSKRSPLKHTCSWRDKLIVLFVDVAKFYHFKSSQWHIGFQLVIKIFHCPRQAHYTCSPAATNKTHYLKSYKWSFLVDVCIALKSKHFQHELAWNKVLLSSL